MHLGELLRRQRARKGMSQEELAARASLSVRAIRDLERGRVAAPHARSLHRLATALNLEPAEVDDLMAAALSAPKVPSAAAPHPSPERDTRDPAPRAAADRAGRLEVGVLGPLTVRVGGVPRDVASAMRRALLGLLALRPHQIVSREEIVDTLWGPRPPRTCQSLIHVYIGQLRSLLEPERARRGRSHTVVLAGGGYRFEVEPDQIDAGEFDAELARAHRTRAAGDLANAWPLYVAALERWRGPVLADVTANVRQHPAALALSQRRVAAALALSDVAERLNRSDQAVPWLRGLARDEALHEGLHARLMLALAASGEQAAALGVFADLRDRLGDELGIVPGIELQEAHLRVLRQDYHRGPVQLAGPSTPAVPPATASAPPAQLPADVAAFTGRAEQLGALRTWREESTDASIVLAAITGTAGVGKTALAIHFAHQVRELYPDGQLYVNLRGYAAGPAVRPIEALAGFLMAMGMRPEQVPDEVGQASALYRSLLADKRVLVLLDNVNQPADVRPLLPAAAGSLVLVTSRDQLGGLVARDGARRIRLDVLNAGEAHTLLGRLVGADRVLAELEATAELANLCARLPLALRIAAANLTAQRDHSLARYASELRAGNRLAALVVDGDEEMAVRAAIDLSYTALPEPAARMFRLLGLVPGPDATVEAAAELADVTPAAAVQLLDRLTRAHLIDQHAPGRYAFHDLLRLYARAKSIEEDAPPDAAAAVERLYRFYLLRTHAAANMAFGNMHRIPLPDGEPVPEPFATPTDGLNWCDGELANILAAVASANAHGPRRYAWLLADAIRGHLLLRAYTVDWLEAARVGLAAAEAEGDPAGQVAMLHSLGVLNLRQSRHDRGVEYHTEALRLARAAGLRRAEANIVGNLGGVCLEQGRLAEGVAHLSEALEMVEEFGFVGGRAHVLGSLGSANLYLGRLEQAADYYRRSIALAQQSGSSVIRLGNLSNYADVCCLLGRLDEVDVVLADVLPEHEATGNRVSDSVALRCLAYVEYERGRLDSALAAATRALGHSVDEGYRRGEAMARSILGAVRLARGDVVLARDELGRAVQVARDSGQHYPEVNALVGLVRGERLLGRHAEALALVEQALSAARAAGFELLEGRALTERAELRREVGDHEAALDDAQRALAVHRRTGHRVGQADTHVLLGRLRGVRNWAAALEHWCTARLLYQEVGSAAAVHVSELIDSHERHTPGQAILRNIGHNGQHQEGSIP